MDSNILARAMGRSLPDAAYVGFLPWFVAAMIQAGCTTPKRAAMWCAQIGHESVGLRYMEELASGVAYEGRKDLGNTQPGDGPRFKGRGPIQLTGRHNYGVFGAWCVSRGLLSDPNYFLTFPTQVANPKWGFLAAAWYWTTQRPKLNQYSDAGDVKAATQAINGGQNGYADRLSRYNTCMSFANQLVPSPVVVGSSAQQRMFLV